MKLRLKYSIEYLSDTEVRFKVLEMDEENIKHVKVNHPNGFDVIYIDRDGATNGAHIWANFDFGLVFLVPNLIHKSTFKSKEHRDKAIEKTKEALNIWKVEAYR